MIPVCKPWMPGNERKYVLDTLDTNWISSAGKYIDKFEEEFAKFCEVEHAVSCNSGYGALHLACMALDLKKGEEVIVPSFTMSAPLLAVILTGAKPVLVDCDKETYCIDVDKIEEKITDRTKAIIAVHIYGHPCEMDRIMEIANKHDLKVIEDAAEAHGAEYNGKKCGSIGDIGCFSFFANKVLTTGEGGMVVTNNPAYSERMKKLKNYAFEVPRFLHRELGANYRMANIQAAIGLAQTENAEMLVEARRNVGLKYNKLLENVKGLILPVEKENCKNVYWMYSVVLDDSVKMSREEVVDKLKEKGIDTRNFFIPMNKQPVFLDGKLENAPDCSDMYPISEKIGLRGFYIPSSSDLTDEEIEFVCDKLKEVLSNNESDKDKKKVVVTSGFFDPLHVGHVELFKLAKEQGDKLIVVLNNDKQVFLKRGKEPFMKEKERKEVIESIKYVDEVFISIDEDESVCKSLESVKPDIFAKGGDRFSYEIPEAKICKDLGIEIVDGLGEKRGSSRDFYNKN